MIKKQLLIYLYFTEDNTVCQDMETFDSLIEYVRRFNSDVVINIKTYCLKALNFDYLNMFDELVVYGKHCHVSFQFEPYKKMKLIKTTIYHTKTNTDISHLYNKQLRYAHNLYNLIIRNSFDGIITGEMCDQIKSLEEKSKD